MRIGYDGKRATQNFRGLGNYSRGIIEGLLDYSNEEIFLYTSSVKDPRAIAWLDSCQKADSPNRFHLTLPQNRINSFFPAAWRSFFILNELKKDSLDLFHGLSHEIPFGINKFPFKSVVTIHDLIFLRYPEYFPWIDRQTYYAKFKYSTSNADLVIAICEQTKKDLIELMGVEEKKIVVHYQSCDPVFYEIFSKIQIDQKLKDYGILKPYILNVGAFEERKNQKNLIHAFANSNHTYEHDLILIGNGKKYLDECKQLVNDLNISNRVKFLSNVSFRDLPYLYQGAALFCFPSFFEGFGLPIVEALFSKIPVITSFGSCFPESAGENSEYINPASIVDIADKIKLVLHSSELRDKMITEGYQFVQKFHRKNSTIQLLDCYSRLF